MNSFIGCFVVLCDFHREQAWQRWLSATKNGMRKMIAPALCHMRRIASSDTLCGMLKVARNSKFTLKVHGCR